MCYYECIEADFRSTQPLCFSHAVLHCASRKTRQSDLIGPAMCCDSRGERLSKVQTIRALTVAGGRLKEAPVYTMFALCITALFSVWVYTLKQQVEALQKRTLAGGHAPSRQNAHAAHVASSPRRSPGNSRFGSAVKTSRERGIPTWTIE